MLQRCFECCACVEGRIKGGMLRLCCFVPQVATIEFGRIRWLSERLMRGALQQPPSLSNAFNTDGLSKRRVGTL